MFILAVIFLVVVRNRSISVLVSYPLIWSNHTRSQGGISASITDAHMTGTSRTCLGRDGLIVYGELKPGLFSPEPRNICISNFDLTL